MHVYTYALTTAATSSQASSFILLFFVPPTPLILPNKRSSRTLMASIRINSSRSVQFGFLVVFSVMLLSLDSRRLSTLDIKLDI